MSNSTSNTADIKGTLRWIKDESGQLVATNKPGKFTPWHVKKDQPEYVKTVQIPGLEVSMIERGADFDSLIACCDFSGRHDDRMWDRLIDYTLEQCFSDRAQAAVAFDREFTRIMNGKGLEWSKDAMERTESGNLVPTHALVTDRGAA
jgi:hypothetical protein